MKMAKPSARDIEAAEELMQVLQQRDWASLISSMESIFQHPGYLRLVERHSIMEREITHHVRVLFKVPAVNDLCTLQTKSSSAPDSQQKTDIGPREGTHWQLVSSLMMDSPIRRLPEKAPSVNHCTRISLQAGSLNNRSHVLERVADTKRKPTSRIQNIILYFLSPRLLMDERNDPSCEYGGYGTYRLNPGRSTSRTPGQLEKAKNQQCCYRRNQPELWPELEINSDFIGQHPRLLGIQNPASLPVSRSGVQRGAA